MSSIASAASFPFLVSCITFIRPLFSNTTKPNSESVCSIFTAWLYVQSTSFASILPYLILEFFFKETSINAGFLLKKMSKLSFILISNTICLSESRNFHIRKIFFREFIILWNHYFIIHILMYIFTKQWAFKSFEIYFSVISKWLQKKGF